MSTPDDPAGNEGTWLPPDVLSQIGSHLTVHDRVLLGSTCKSWRKHLSAGVVSLDHDLDDCTNSAARRHTSAGWRGMLVVSSRQSPLLREARVCVAGNLLSRESLAVQLEGLAAHSQLTSLALIQAPHVRGFTPPARPPAPGSRLRRRGRTAQLPRTVMPLFGAQAMNTLFVGLRGLHRLSLRGCVMLRGFDAPFSLLTALRRLELVPLDLPGQVVGQPSWVCRADALGALGPTLEHLTLGGQLARPSELAALAPRLSALRGLRLVGLSLHTHEWLRNGVVIGVELPEADQEQQEAEAGAQMGPALKLGEVLRDCFTQLGSLELLLLEDRRNFEAYTGILIPFLTDLAGLRARLRLACHPAMPPLAGSPALLAALAGLGGAAVGLGLRLEGGRWAAREAPAGELLDERMAAAEEEQVQRIWRDVEEELAAEGERGGQPPEQQGRQQQAGSQQLPALRPWQQHAGRGPGGGMMDLPRWPSLRALSHLTHLGLMCGCVHRGRRRSPLPFDHPTASDLRHLARGMPALRSLCLAAVPHLALGAAAANGAPPLPPSALLADDDNEPAVAAAAAAGAAGAGASGIFGGSMLSALRDFTSLRHLQLLLHTPARSQRKQLEVDGLLDIVLQLGGWGRDVNVGCGGDGLCGRCGAPAGPLAAASGGIGGGGLQADRPAGGHHQPASVGGPSPAAAGACNCICHSDGDSGGSFRDRHWPRGMVMDFAATIVLQRHLHLNGAGRVALELAASLLAGALGRLTAAESSRGGGGGAAGSAASTSTGATDGAEVGQGSAPGLPMGSAAAVRRGYPGELLAAAEAEAAAAAAAQAQGRTLAADVHWDSWLLINAMMGNAPDCVMMPSWLVELLNLEPAALYDSDGVAVQRPMSDGAGGDGGTGGFGVSWGVQAAARRAAVAVRARDGPGGAERVSYPLASLAGDSFWPEEYGRENGAGWMDLDSMLMRGPLLDLADLPPSLQRLELRGVMGLTNSAAGGGSAAAAAAAAALPLPVLSSLQVYAHNAYEAWQVGGSLEEVRRGGGLPRGCQVRVGVGPMDSPILAARVPPGEDGTPEGRVGP